MLGAHVLWDNGYTGKGIKVAVFDTGLSRDHPHFRNVREAIDYTNDEKSDDVIGHGTFVAGIIASDYEGCPGFAPDAELYIFRVFNKDKLSFTSWFLDAFNYAIHIGIDVLNLSIGGHDFMDRPFVDKIYEMSANNIVVVSAIGNDGPTYGTLSNPADQSDVIGVGSIDSFDKLSTFSSRGMTTWELPHGYGRVKPDIVTYGSSVLGSNLPKLGTKCRTLSGTSVSSPVVAGAIALLMSSVPQDRRHLINPASIKQVLIESSQRIGDANIFEQGNGKLNLVDAFKMLQRYTAKVSFSPSSVDFTDCPYFWPYCSQPIYHDGLPTIVNVTIINGMDVSGQFIAPPKWIPGKNGNLLHVGFSYQELLWPWTGHLGLHLSATKAAANFEGIIEGFVQVNITSPPRLGEKQPRFQSMMLPVRVQVIPTPPRAKRILWDQYHSLRYPSGFLPKDALDMDEPFDWNGDHPHTNFRAMYQRLRESGYFLEVLNSPLTCFDPKSYGALLIVDPEEEFFPSEIKKIEEDVRANGLNLIVFADWYNVQVMNKIKFLDPNTKKDCTPVTGASNIPALNDFLSNFGIYFGDTIYNGEFTIGSRTGYYSSGTSIVGFPKGGRLLYTTLSNLNRQILMSLSGTARVPILGFYQTLSMEDELSSTSSEEDQNPGKIVVFGDSSCLDEAIQKAGARYVDDCYWLLDNILQVTQEGKDLNTLFPGLTQIEGHLLPYEGNDRTSWSLPKRPSDLSEMEKLSQVMHSKDLQGDMCSSHPFQVNEDKFYWESHHKYHNLSWSNRAHVLPSEYPTYPPDTNHNINPQYLYPYILIILALVLLLAHFFRKKPTRQQARSSSEAVQEAVAFKVQ
ncbi:membrane-bound transcription factor peptidase [Heterostelium album PN500]|uniref:Membrane-bound transcription factor peptidase n=1 Tax=Heterostelium pallidum (strain ATCC 26659 / Pp 5 / PN500) TaxID=670386 RepID=D3BJF1_HETP5|nr:membrane-bound transcription factor peptidase [Heterostelium album PN500]EFA78031.1 membrane-bound transcription factor peptidase [Heterostelium album PN500]|eukprot:XP_020430159.1 membrane-bound transcription factor peptidase [Heterostelium album PN500]